jgi:branched-chain amino acid transport system substrate-binding protein
MAKFAANTLKAKKVAILVDVRSDYPLASRRFSATSFKQLGGEIGPSSRTARATRTFAPS